MVYFYSVFLQCFLPVFLTVYLTVCFTVYFTVYSTVFYGGSRRFSGFLSFWSHFLHDILPLIFRIFGKKSEI